MRKLSWRGALCAGMAWGVLSGAALAVDGKVYGGGACTPADSGGVFQRNSLNGRLENTSTSSTMIVNCPTVKDRMKGDGLVTDGRTAVYVMHRNPNVPFQCLMLVYGEDKSAAPLKQEYVSTSTVSTSVQTLTFSSAVGGAKGYYHLSCWVPPAVGTTRSSVHAYSLTEKD